MPEYCFLIDLLKLWYNQFKFFAIIIWKIEFITNYSDIDMEPAIIVKSKKGKKNRGKQNQESKQNKFVNEWEKDLINPSPATHIKIEPVQNKTKNKQQKKGKKNNQLYV